MIVEHSFVTTADSADALAAATSLLGSRGFIPVVCPPSSGGAEVMEMRGLKNGLCRVRVQWDRGRVSVELSTTRPVSAEVLMGIARSLEMLLTHESSPEAAVGTLDYAQMHGGVGRTSSSLWIILVVIIAIFVAVAVATR